MGEIAQMMETGEQCSRCGTNFVKAHGFPVVCRECFKDQKEDIYKTKVMNKSDALPRATHPEI